jgi:hypothetical protein
VEYKTQLIMNKLDRKNLEQAIALLNDAKSIIEDIASQERDKYDNLSEGLQQSDRGQAMEENADELESINDEIDNVIDAIENVIYK